MAATNDRIDARQSEPPVSGGAAAASRVDARWLAQAIEARELAYRLYRVDLQTDLSSVVRLDVCCPSPIDDPNKLREDYLTANERLFDLTAAPAKERVPQPPSAVDNSSGTPAADDFRAERIPE